MKRDESGGLEPIPLIDNGEVDDDDTLIRVIRPNEVNFDFDPPRPRDIGFQDQKAEVAQERFGLAGACASVAIKSVWEARSGRIEDLLKNFPSGSGLAEIRVGDARTLTTRGAAGKPHQARPQGVMPNKRLDAPWHAVIFDRSGARRSSGARWALAEHSTWLHAPTPPEPSTSPPQANAGQIDP